MTLAPASLEPPNDSYICGCNIYVLLVPTAYCLRTDMSLNV